MAWKYLQSSGDLVSPTDMTTAIGYSGVGPGLNNPAMQNVPDEGPIPAGIYEIGAPVDDPKTGLFSMPLTPDPSNNMFGRSAFRIHGDNSLQNYTASEGCVILPRQVRESIWNSLDHVLIVLQGGTE